MIDIIVVQGDITKINCEAIVNPANSLLVMGGGVAGAIKREGGYEIEREAIKHAPCPVGKAVITNAGRLPAKYVIHAPTMERPAMRTSKEKVIKAIIASLEVAEENHINCVAFPGMGTGVGGLSEKEAKEAFIEAFNKFFRKKQTYYIRKIMLVAFTRSLFDAFREVKEKVKL